MGMKMRRRPSAARRQAPPLLHLCRANLCTWVNNERPGRRAGRQALTSKYSICCSHAENGYAGCSACCDVGRRAAGGSGKRTAERGGGQLAHAASLNKTCGFREGSLWLFRAETPHKTQLELVQLAQE